MPQMQLISHRPGRAAAVAVAPLLSTLVYRSRARRPFSNPALRDLAAAASLRNRAEAITGVVLYDDSHFFQWLEGPEESLSRVMRSINADARHTEIEVLTRQRVGARTFAGWDMKLAACGTSPAAWTREIIRPSRESIEALRRRPEIAAEVLAQMRPQEADARAALLEGVLRARVIPELAARHAVPAPDPARARAADLARLLLAGDRDAVRARLQGLCGASGARLGLHLPLFDAAARHLGDLWDEDEIGAFDVTLGLFDLQFALTGLRAAQTTGHRGSVLVSAAPGEPHRLGAALAVAGWEQAGWAATLGADAGEDLFLDRLAASRFEVLHLALSPAFRRADDLPRLRQVIALARRATRGPALVVSVSGRAFAEGLDTAATVGADRLGPPA